MLHTVEVSAVVNSKAWESNNVLRMVSYAKIPRINVLLSKLIDILLKNRDYQNANFVNLNPSFYRSCPCESTVGGMYANSTGSTMKNYVYDRHRKTK